jgi:hypothetical protein
MIIMIINHEILYIFLFKNKYFYFYLSYKIKLLIASSPFTLHLRIVGESKCLVDILYGKPH